jgi:hypothetical protein
MYRRREIGRNNTNAHIPRTPSFNDITNPKLPANPADTNPHHNNQPGEVN